MCFLFGCATAKMAEYVSFKDAVAKTGSRCHYTSTAFLFGYTKEGDPKPGIEYDEHVKMLLSKRWRLRSWAQNTAEWEKCK